MRIVQKFGGTSVADIGRLENVALKVKREVDAGRQVAVVVSAMAGVTNQLVNYAKTLTGSDAAASPEYDAVVSTGEQITTGLLALALQQIGIPARSFMGWQLPIRTDSDHTCARIKSIDPKQILGCWEEDIVPIVAGFQGINSKKRITTLGRGGSDTTAVSLAAALKADRCDIYTDVDGVYTADPRIVPLAQKLPQISYEEMLELAAQGAKVLHQRSVEEAMRHNIPVQVLSSFEDKPGTMMSADVEPGHTSRISGITQSANWVLLKLYTDASLAQQAKTLMRTLQARQVPVDMASCHFHEDPNFISVMIPQSYLATVITLIELNKRLKVKDMGIETNLAKLTIVGLGLISGNGYSEHLLRLVNTNKLPLSVVAISQTKLCLGVREGQAEDMVRLLHTHFKLDRISNDDIKEAVATWL